MFSGILNLRFCCYVCISPMVLDLTRQPTISELHLFMIIFNANAYTEMPFQTLASWGYLLWPWGWKWQSYQESRKLSSLLNTCITLVISNHKAYVWGERNYFSRRSPREPLAVIVWGQTKEAIVASLIFYYLIVISYLPHLDNFITQSLVSLVPLYPLLCILPWPYWTAKNLL